MNHIRQVFGEDADLYQVLGLQREEDPSPAKLRKAYYRQALVWHPDKTTRDPAEAKNKFQALSFAYQVLKNPEKRQEYNETGHVDEEGDEDDDTKKASFNTWKEYFDRIFGKVTASKIDQFAEKYKCSEEEQKDVLKAFKQHKGDLVKMLDYVMLSTEVDAKRWMEDYIQPAMEDKTIPDYSDAANKSLKKLEKRIAKQQEKENQKHDDDESNASEDEMDNENDEDEEEEEEDEAMSDSETESEDEEALASPSPPTKATAKVATNKNKTTPKKVTATKAKPTKAKASKKNNSRKSSSKKKGSSQDDLVAMIQANHAKRSGGLFDKIGARYGVTMNDDDNDSGGDGDPLNDEEFAKIQARVTKQKNANKKQRARR